MRILFCNYEYPPLGGGGGVINAALAQELAKDHEVTVLTSRGAGLPAVAVEQGVKVVRVPVLGRTQKSVASLTSMLTFLPSGIRAGRELLASTSFDIINTHFVLPTGPVGDALARMSGLPNVVSLHGGDLYDPSKSLSPHRNALMRAWIRKLLRRADLIVGQSTNTISNMHRFYTPELQGIRIPLGIDRPTARPATRQQFNLANDETLLVTIGRLIARKGNDQLIRLMEEYRGKRVRLLIIGSGPEEPALRAQVQASGLENQVCFMGRVSDEEKQQILELSDLYVSTSQHEGFGLVFLEAMAAGLPVVCYDNGGQTDFLVDGETGHLVGLNKLDLFRARCKSLIEDAALRRVMGATNRVRVEDLYIDQCARRYEDAFSKVLATRTNRKNAWAFGSRAM